MAECPGCGVVVRAYIDDRIPHCRRCLKLTVQAARTAEPCHCSQVDERPHLHAGPPKKDR